MATALTSENVQDAWSALVEDVRTAVLLTMRNGRPFGSHVPYIFGSDWSRAYLHLSRLALHTQHLLADPHVSLFIAEPDGPGKNPLALRRMNLQGEAAILSPDAPMYDEIKQRYLERFPQAEMMFGFGDFALWELRLSDAHFVLGFGQAFVSTATTPSRWIHQKVDRQSPRKD
jgi:putative heme iron utilization protein